MRQTCGMRVMNISSVKRGRARMWGTHSVCGALRRVLHVWPGVMLHNNECVHSYTNVLTPLPVPLCPHPLSCHTTPSGTIGRIWSPPHNINTSYTHRACMYAYIFAALVSHTLSTLLEKRATKETILLTTRRVCTYIFPYIYI